ncbi:hypothetical protein LCGC14_1127530 [marine sediment metagenome]|uniref:Haem-binding domain-containing protein n=2 Tax=root TaxID=1 RepID=A0A831QME5_9FLAO|nr:hypothetical protein [Pricia sp.]HEA19750.1 hypothetical protein [Pricia antarctica]
MTMLAKIIIGIILSFLAEQHPKTDLAQSYVPAKSMYTVAEDSIQLRAYKILSNKCNVCQEKHNRRRVFTDENMNPWANDIYKQVFIKKRMPKGKKIKLTNEEYQELLKWISPKKT